MKKVKILFFSLIFLFFVTVIFSGSIKVNSPDGGENWKIGSVHNITWNPGGVLGDIVIKLMKGNTMLGSIAWKIPNSGNYSWTINNIQGTPIQTGNDYKVLIRSLDDLSIQDKSDSYFTISKKDGEVLIPWWEFELHKPLKIIIDPDPGPYRNPEWKLMANVLVQGIREKVGTLPLPVPEPAGIFLMGARGNTISKLGVVEGEGIIKWEVEQAGGGLQGCELIIRPGEERARHMLKTGEFEFKIILKNMRTGEILREIPVEAEIIEH